MQTKRIPFEIQHSELRCGGDLEDAVLEFLFHCGRVIALMRAALRGGGVDGGWGLNLANVLGVLSKCKQLLMRPVLCSARPALVSAPRRNPGRSAVSCRTPPARSLP